MRVLRHYGIEIALVTSLGLAVLFFGYLAFGLLPRNVADKDFDGRRALEDAGRQMAFGARVTGTQANLQLSQWLTDQLTGLGWDVVTQEFGVAGDVKGHNIIAVRSPRAASSLPVILLTTHYDTRAAADGDPIEDNRTRPAPGANNGASGTSVLLELARTLDVEKVRHTVCLAFFDADANAGLPGWDGRMGSATFARTMDRDVARCAEPAAVIALDLVGGDRPRFAHDAASSVSLWNALWQSAAQLGYASVFVEDEAAPTSGAHLAFAERRLPVALIADADYADAATLADTIGRLRAATLAQVGRTLETWLESGGVGESVSR